MRCRSCNIGENDLYGEPTFIYDGLCIDCRNVINYVSKRNYTIHQ
jgi:hypothetical protein